jgi:TIR domain
MEMALTEVMFRINAAINRQRPDTEIFNRSVFISYASADVAIASRCADNLKAGGFEPWWDRELRGGQRFREEIMARLDAAAVAVVLWSPTSIRSPWVQAEADRAMTQNKLVPVRMSSVAGTEVPPPFNMLQTLALDDYAGLIKSLGAVANSGCHCQVR